MSPDNILGHLKLPKRYKTIQKQQKEHIVEEHIAFQVSLNFGQMKIRVRSERNALVRVDGTSVGTIGCVSDGTSVGATTVLVR